MTFPDAFLSIDPFAWQGVLSAVVCGGIVGIERQISGKPVGIRTSALICLGAYVYVSIANAVANGATDNSRIIGQVVTGVGFLGAGVMMARDGIVIGVTSAASIWVLAAIGVTIGCGEYLSGIKLAILTIIILVGVNLLEGTFKLFQHGVHRRYSEVIKRRNRQDDDLSL